ncbi:hypothetical protein J4419_05090 [Candidatus Woesearchaeota archaeon]|nr:hypothetical protein [Candidatus Woesearchaeota archaeon]
MCKTYHGLCAYTLTALGILFLLRDLGALGTWNFWGIQWWTALILLAGLCGLMGHGHCCCHEEDMPKKKK